MNRFLFLLASVLIGCESKSAQSYRDTQKNSDLDAKMESLKSLAKGDADFAQARIDLGQYLWRQGKKDSASVMFNEAISILSTRQGNELNEKDLDSSLGDAFMGEIEWRVENFSQIPYQTRSQIDEEYSRLEAFVRKAADRVPSVATSDLVKKVLNKDEFKNNHTLPFQSKYLGYLEMNSRQIGNVFNGCKRIDQSGILDLSGHKIAYDYFLQYGSCQIHNRTVNQEYTSCVMFFFKEEKCFSIRELPGITMTLRYNPSVQSGDLLKDHLVMPMAEIQWVKTKSVPFDPFVQWIASFKNKSGYAVDITTLESEAYNPNLLTRENNFIMDYFVSRIPID